MMQDCTVTMTQHKKGLLPVIQVAKQPAAVEDHHVAVNGPRIGRKDKHYQYHTS